MWPTRNVSTSTSFALRRPRHSARVLMIVAEIYAAQSHAATADSSIRPQRATVTTLLPDAIAAPTQGAAAPSGREGPPASINLRAQPGRREAPRESAARASAPPKNMPCLPLRYGQHAAARTSDRAHLGHGRRHLQSYRRKRHGIT
eukprot:9503978-Pyramimonas_sp.AAC.2